MHAHGPFQNITTRPTGFAGESTTAEVAVLRLDPGSGRPSPKPVCVLMMRAEP